MFWIVGGRTLAMWLTRVFADPVPDGIRYHLGHPAWIGFSAWDLIMPLFLFVVGAAMPFSVSRRIESGEPKSKLYAKIIRRVVVLFVLGMAYQGNLLDFDLSTLQLYCNTLQAIAAGYLIAGIVILNLRVVGQLGVLAALLVVYWMLMMFVPFGGHPAGTLEPDANVALAVDDLILRNFGDGISYTWILSSLGFGATTLLGVQAGNLLRSGLSPVAKVLRLVAWGVGCLAAGWIWENYLGFPLIKHIWTSSMVLWAAGWSYLLLALFYGLIDILGYRQWAFPFIVIGANAITAYMAARFIPFDIISGNLLGGLARFVGSPWDQVLLSLGALSILWIALFYMYRKKTFVRIG